LILAMAISASVAYVAASLLYLHYFVTRKQAAELVGRWALSIGFVIQTVLLTTNYLFLGRFPVIDLKESLCFFSWSMSGMYLAMRRRPSAAPLGTFVAPVIAAFFVVAAILPGKTFTPDDRFKTILFPFHILVSFGGYAAFALAFGSGIMYLLQERGLKARRPGKMQERLPSLSELDGLLYGSLAIGFPLLTVGLVLGAIWLHKVQGVFVEWDPKIVASMVTWLVYAVILHTRLLTGWRGRRMAAMSIFGFALVLITFLGAGAASSGFHNFFK